MAATGDRPGLSECFRWLTEKKFFHRANERLATYSHTLFNGGLLDVTDECYGDFIKNLARDMDHGHQWFINEVATEVTAVYLDCDFQDSRPEEGTAEFADFVAEVVETDLRKQRAELDAQVAQASEMRRSAQARAALSLPPIFLAAKPANGSGDSAAAASVAVAAVAGAASAGAAGAAAGGSTAVSGAASSSNMSAIEAAPAKKKKKKASRPVDINVVEVGARLSRVYLFNFVNALQRCIFDYYRSSITSRDDPRLTCVVMTTSKDKYAVAEAKEWDASRNATVKSTRILSRKYGVHIVWPWPYATQVDMLDLREGMLRAVGQQCGDRSKHSNAWSKVIDHQIYLPVPALRMVNCDKVEECELCKKGSRWRTDCAKCHGAPPASGRVYRPEYSFNGEGRLTTHAAQCLENTEYMLRLCTIRRPGLTGDEIHDDAKARVKCEDGIPVFRVPDTAPRYDGARHAYRQPKIGEKKAKADFTNSARVEETRGLKEFGARREVRRIDPGCALFREVEEFLRSNAMPKFYRQVIVDTVVEYAISNSRYYMVRVSGPGAKFCQNVGREHNAMRAYFHITRSRGCQQKCFCRCTEAKPGNIPAAVLCSAFASPGIALTHSLEKQLFTAETAAAQRESERAEQQPALTLVDAHPDSSFLFPDVTPAGSAKLASTASKELRRNISQLTHLIESHGGKVSGVNEGDDGDEEVAALRVAATAEAGLGDDDDRDEECEQSVRRRRTAGMTFEFDAMDPECVGMRVPDDVPPATTRDRDEEEQRIGDRFIRRRYPGDAELMRRPLPAGKVLIPTRNRHAPGSEEDARRMLREAQMKEEEQSTARLKNVLANLFLGYTK